MFMVRSWGYALLSCPFTVGIAGHFDDLQMNRRGRLNEGVADGLHHRFQGLRHPCTRRDDGRRTHRLPI